jgi:basic membrane protein A and related proteins
MRWRAGAMLAVAVIVAVALGASGGRSVASGRASCEQKRPERGRLDKVGLVFDVGGRGDRSFNDASAAGVERAQKKLGFVVKELSPAAGGQDRGQQVELLAGCGFSPIITVGFAFATELAKSAPRFPNTQFVQVDAVVDLPNVTSLVFAEEQGSFLVGVVAAERAKSGVVGFVGGAEFPLIKKFEAGFEAGAKAAKPNIKVLSTYIAQDPSGFSAPDKGRAAAEGLLDKGADVVFHAAGQSGKGVFEAARDRHKLAIGVDSDQYQSIGDPSLQPVIITSMVKRVDVAVEDALTQAAQGRLKGGAVVYDLKKNGVGYSTSGGFIDDLVPTLEKYKRRIIDGEIKVPTTPSR